MENSYIIRFPDEQSRSEFQRVLEERPDISPENVTFGEFLPDVIVRGLSDEKLSEMKDIADPEARFFGDFKHDLFVHR